MLQRRVDGNVSFERPWEEYKRGFGDLEKNLWLGNDFIHRLTRTKREILFDMESVAGDKGFLLYRSFQVEGENSDYRMHISGYQNNTVGDCMRYHNGMKFSTSDRDNDLSDDLHCATFRNAGWWYKGCTACHLNGLYDFDDPWDRIYLKKWNEITYLDKVQIKIRDQYGKQNLLFSL